MNSIYCQYPSIEHAVIKEVMDVFRDGDEVDMSQVHRTLQEMCPASDQTTASRQTPELAQKPLHGTSGAAVARVHDVSTLPARPEPARSDAQPNLYETDHPGIDVAQEHRIGPGGGQTNSNATSATEGASDAILSRTGLRKGLNSTLHSVRIVY